ncbi:MAG TPA: hypothetical protein DCE43_18760 [Planctomycetaceae bacterium]|nr:hypothetical protein [Planctomycetaceae bacterium]
MHSSTFLTSLALGCLVAAPLQAAPPNPVITNAWPAGARAGSTVSVTLTGSGIDKQGDLQSSAPGLQAEPVSTGKPGIFRITIPKTTSPGLYEIRLAGPAGVSTPRTFQVGNRREVLEQEPNSTPATAKPVPIDSTVNGQILEAGDQDCYRFTATRGQRVVLECWAERIDSKLHPILQLFDSDGRLLKVSRGYYGIDPLIDFRVPENGDYIVRLHDLTYTGSPNHTYRLDIDTGPRVAVALPGVIRRGQPARITLLGWNLADRTDAPYPALDRVDVEIPAETTTKPDWPLPVRLTAAQTPFDAIAWQLPGAHAPILIGITDVPVVIENNDNHTPDKAQQVKIPCEAGGRLVAADEKDWYSFEARRGEAIYIELIGERMGSPVHLAASVLDATGNNELLQCRRDPRNLGGLGLPTRHSDPSGRFLAPADGRYTVVIYNRSAGIHPDPRRAYRLSLRREVPTADVAVISPGTNPRSLNVAPGGRTLLDVVAFRRRGAHGSIRISATNLPDGVSCPDIFLGPGVTRGQLVLSADLGATRANGSLSLWSSLADKNNTARRPARIGTVVQAGRPTGWSRLAHNLALGIAGDSPVRVTADGHETRVHQLYGELKVRHAPGGVLDVAIEVERKDPNHRAEVQLIGTGLPPDIANRTATIPAAKDKGYISFYLPPQLTPGRYTLGVQATTTVLAADGKKTQTVTVSSNPVVFDVHEPMFHVTLDPYNPRTIKRGQIAQIKYKVRRLNGFINKVHSELAAPGTVTKVGGLRGRGVTFVGQTETGAIQVVASDDAPLGQRAFLRIYAVGVLEDQALYHGSHFLQLQIVE